jgi:glycosyltransferase 2 family protein
VIDQGRTFVLPRDATWNEPDRRGMTVTVSGRKQYVLGVDLSADLSQVHRFLLSDNPNGPTTHIVPADGVSGYQITIPHPRVRIGVLRMIRHARPWYLLAGLAVFPITIVITTMRWHELLKPLGIHLTLMRTFVLNMVGMFYNTIGLGSTGGDVAKMYYVAKQTHHGTRAVMSVLFDRAIGLLALILLGGIMAALQWHIRTCREVAIASAVLLAGAGAGAIVFYIPQLRRSWGLNRLIQLLPMQDRLGKAIEAMHIYSRRPLLVAGALLVSFPVHITVVISAMFCGFAFGLPISPFYYWMAVPVIVLVGSIPISPQGAGVQEYFAIKLLQSQQVTVAQAFALTMSIRLMQMIWNLVGGIVVFRGGYHVPTPVEQKEVEAEDEDAKA